MSAEALRLILQFAGVVVGVGGGQLIIFFFKRRSELRSLDSKSTATELDSANAYIQTLQKGENVWRERLERVEVELRSIRQDLDTEKAAHATTRVKLVEVQSDLAVARATINSLSQRLSGQIGHPGWQHDQSN